MLRKLLKLSKVFNSHCNKLLRPVTLSRSQPYSQLFTFTIDEFHNSGFSFAEDVKMPNDNNNQGLSSVNSKEVKELSPKDMQEIMELIEKDFSSMFHLFYEDLLEPSATSSSAASDLSNSDMVHKVKNFLHEEENWCSGRIGDLLTNCEVSPSVWEKCLDYYIKEDSEFGYWYKNWEEALLEKSLPLVELSEEQYTQLTDCLKDKWKMYCSHEKYKNIMNNYEMSRRLREKIKDDIEEAYGVNMNCVYDEILPKTTTTSMRV
jgi:ribosomal protein S13